MSSIKLSIVIGLVLPMMGCGVFKPPSDLPEIPANLATPCPPLQQIDSGDAGSLLKWGVVSVKQYAECQSRHKRLVEAWPK